MRQNLLSTTTRVQVPTIIAKIGEYEFGLYEKTKTNVLVNEKYYSALRVTYPNYMQSLSVKKVNGTLNNYTLTLVYPITQNDDPNLIERILSSTSKSRKIVFTYGDCALPAFMYRQEEALITKVTSQLDIASSRITYTINAVSAAAGLNAGVRTFEYYASKKPSDRIKELLRDKTSGLQDIFYGMHNYEQVLSLGLIPGDDREVEIPKKSGVTVLQYLEYLVGCMSNTDDSNTSQSKTYRYVLTMHDDTRGILDGPYFKISSVISNIQEDSSIDIYEVDIGYPNKDIVIGFSIDDNESYSLLYDYSKQLRRADYVYRVGDDGNVEAIYSPALSNSPKTLETTAYDKTWWSQMTQYPIKATLTIKGLLRAAILMSYLRVNVYFYGRKHISSGVYVITQQVDNISTSGYSTTLSLVRIQGDDKL